MLLSLIAFVLVLGTLIVLHEAGHFTAARAVGAEVEVFSVGFGRRLWGFTRGGTEYRLSLVPLGGYVRIRGMGPDESRREEDPEQLLPRWKRGVILFAGPLTNVFAAVLFLAVSFTVGVEVPAYRSQPATVGWVEPGSPAARAELQPGDTVVALDGSPIRTWRDLESALADAGGREVKIELVRGEQRLQVSVRPERDRRYGFGSAGVLPPLDPEVRRLVPGSPAERAGLAPGDRIVAVNGEPVQQFYDLIRLISPHPGEPVSLTVRRGATTREVTVVPENYGGEGKVGIALVFPTVLERQPPLAAVGTAASECWRMTRETLRVIGRLLARKASVRHTLSGPVDIARLSGEAARSGPRTLVWFLGVISLQLGIFNLLPVPVLDGGHLAILGLETAIRRDLPVRVKERIIEIGFVLILLLMVVVLYNDIVKALPASFWKLLHKSPSP